MGQSEKRLTFLGMRAIIASPAMRELLDRVMRVAQSEASVLITGESGTGKELVARALHHFSRRSAGPWIDINCAALPDHLVESELFGYERGAFSGADTAKAGLFELAHGGTLLLDEIGELEPRVQAKLLRVLDQVPYFRLGGTRKVAVDVRILAATNQDLTAATRQGRLRRDLYHRLRQVHLHVPALRERREDIVPLAEFFLEQQAPGQRLTEEALRTLVAYPWPGNVREVKNAIMSASAVGEGGVIRAEDLNLDTVQEEWLEDQVRIMNLCALERQTILRAFEESGQHHQKAADLLGISARTLSRKLKTYGTDKADEPHAGQG